MAESIQAIPPFTDAAAPSISRRVSLRPTSKEWLRHSFLFLLTAVSTTIAGLALVAPELRPAVAEPHGVVGWIFFIPQYYFLSIASLIDFALRNPHILVQGLTFSAALLTILLSHEMGHYIACRRYGIAAPLPYFIPAPPLSLAGTFGAFIKIKSPITTRRALFDIGLAGSLAGFVALLPIAVIGILTIGKPLAPQGHEIFFN